MTRARAVALQGGGVEGGWLLAEGSRATASGVEIDALELKGGSLLETRGGGRGREEEEPGWNPAFPGAGARWLRHAAAPRLVVGGSEVTLSTDGGGLAWLGVAPRLGFQARARCEGVLLLDPASAISAGDSRRLLGGRTSWSLGALPRGTSAYLQAFVPDPGSGRLRLSDVVRVER